MSRRRSGGIGGACCCLCATIALLSWGGCSRDSRSPKDTRGEHSEVTDACEEVGTAVSDGMPVRDGVAGADSHGDAVGEGCSPGVFGQEFCGHGFQTREGIGCADCLEVETPVPCVFQESVGDSLIHTACRCVGGKYYCNWLINDTNYGTCFSSSDCARPGDGSGSAAPDDCVELCSSHATPVCAPPCVSNGDCDLGSYCTSWIWGVDREMLSPHCLPRETWSCRESCRPWVSPWCSCVTDADCPGGYCVPGKRGAFCTPPLCEEPCPQDLQCLPFPRGSEYSSFACLERTLLLCRPCVSDSDCLLPWNPVDQGDKCIIHGENGGFCGVNCDSWPYRTGCPSGYSCTAGQCVLDSGECDCPPYHVEMAAFTVCSVSNQYGVCQGTRVCSKNGLTSCDAETPGAEVCDGLDNDCDGAIDENVCGR